MEREPHLFEELCKKGKAYRAKRMAAGEKSSAYLSGRAVKVCKGQMQGEGDESEGGTDYDMLRSIQRDEQLDTLGDIISKYVKDPDDANAEVDRFDDGGFDNMSDMVTANLLRDPEYKAWYDKVHSIKETNKIRKAIRKIIKEQNFDDRLRAAMGAGEFEKATTPQMPEAAKVWDALVKTFSDNKNDSISYLNSDKTYRSIAITAIFRAMNF